jgi:hypothetical protein
MGMSGRRLWRLVRLSCKFCIPSSPIEATPYTNSANSIIDEGLKFLERKFFIQKGNEKLEAQEQNGRTKRD